MIREAATRRVCVLTALLLLGGCATQPPAATGMARWAGRLSLQVGATAGQPARAVSASFDLAGDGDAGELRLSGPLGATLAMARWSPGRYELDDGSQTRRYDSLQSLTEAGFGEPLPLAALFAWLGGRPWPGAAHRVLAEGPGRFEQLGWSIDAGGLDEGRLVARRDGEPAITLRIRLDNPPS